MIVERLFLAVPRGSLQFVIVVFPDHTHLLFWSEKGDLWQIFDSIRRLQRAASSIPSVDAISNAVVDANATVLVWLSWYCAVACASFIGIKVTTNRQKMGLIKCNC